MRKTVRATPLYRKPAPPSPMRGAVLIAVLVTMALKTYLAVAVVLSLAVECTGQSVPTNCNSTTILCGSNAHCDQGVCQCDGDYFSPTGVNTDCRSKNESDPRCNLYDPECVYCGPTFQGPCQKCIDFIQGTTCTTECTDFVIMFLLNITSKVCNDRSLQGQGLPEWTIIVFAVTGVVIVAVVVSLLIGLSVLFLNRSSHGRFDVEDVNQDILISESTSGTLRTKRSNSFSYQQEDNGKSEEVQYNSTYNTTEPDEETRFMQKLEYLRTQAEIFLKMLNDMRRRLKELSPDAPAAQQYRNVMRDVTRLLYLLNKKPSNVQMPADGIILLDWSEKVLNRYLKSQGMIPKPFEATNRLSVLGPQDETHF